MQESWLFLFAVVVICQPSLYKSEKIQPHVHNPIISESYLNPNLEYQVVELDPNIQLISDAYNSQQRSREPVPYLYNENNRRIDGYNRNLLVQRSSPQNPAIQTRFKTILDNELHELDREALSTLTEFDRNILVTQLTSAERESLINSLDEKKVAEVLPKTRFASAFSSSIASAAANIGANAGSYIGNKLGGSIGAKLGAAAGAYLGAAAANRFNPRKSKNTRQRFGAPSEYLTPFYHSE